VKLVVESALAFVALLVLLPLLTAVAILIKLDSRGPVFFADRREAKGGRTFRCLKFRTMVTGAEGMQRELMAKNAVDGPQFKMRKDPRLTRLGRWLRGYSIDELPQLFNVLVGQMSLVGPRPSPFRENQTCVPWREGRLSVRPGITGLWQVCRHNREEGDFHQWIEYDLLYVRHMSALLDLKIIAATILTLGGKGCVPLQWIIPARRHQPSDR
jgi:lipopolysaccharide/colanic/teichoic acid biosynthesis glycosyltransferase